MVGTSLTQGQRYNEVAGKAGERKKENTMNLLLVVKVVTLCLMVVGPATCDIIFDLNTPTNYANFVALVRTEVQDKTKSYFGLPIMKAPNSTKKYLYIQVNARKNGKLPAISVTLQLKTADLYLVAYRDKDATGKDRYFYFKGLIDKTEVFPDVKGINPEPTKCSYEYPSIQTAAKKEIKDLEFRLPNLEDAMRNAYGKSTTQADFKQAQALFLLYSIEMTAEAARFKYIELKTVNKQKSDVKVASLVLLWDKLSVQIVGADKDGNFIKTIEVQIAENPTKYLEVKNVADIKPDIGLLKYIKP